MKINLLHCISILLLSISFIGCEKDSDTEETDLEPVCLESEDNNCSEQDAGVDEDAGTESDNQEEDAGEESSCAAEDCGEPISGGELCEDSESPETTCERSESGECEWVVAECSTVQDDEDCAPEFVDEEEGCVEPEVDPACEPETDEADCDDTAPICEDELVCPEGYEQVEECDDENVCLSIDGECSSVICLELQEVDPTSEDQE